MPHTIAVVQEPPVFLDLEASLARACELIARAAADGAELVVFPETYLPGYPSWIWRLRPGADMALLADLHRRLADGSVDLDADGLQPIRAAAKQHGVTVVVGVNERDGRFSRATLFNTVVVVGADGRVLNRHRKLVPTNPERTVWGMGDASGLRVVDTPVGRVGVLICWENYMPLARFALYADGVEVYVAPTWDCGGVWQSSLRHIAREGGCTVVGCAVAMQARDVPPSFPERERVFPDEDEWLCSGGSVVVDPAATIVAGPMEREPGVLTAEIDPLAVRSGRRSLDVAGHYGRPDVFHLEIDRRPGLPLTVAEH